MGVYDCDNLLEIWLNGKRLLDRFGVKRQDTWRAGQKMQEEVTELLRAETDDEILKEAVDVIVTVLNYVRSSGLSYDELEAAVIEVCRKNDAKTEKTHTVVNGLIQRNTGYTWNGHAFVNE